MPHRDNAPASPRRWDERQDSGDARVSTRRQQENEELLAVLRALRAADFDLGEPDNGDDERLLTQMYREWRGRFERRQRNRQRRNSFIRWFAMFVAGAVVTLFGQDAHVWLKTHWSP